jgi:hypothetical protein
MMSSPRFCFVEVISEVSLRATINSFLALEIEVDIIKKNHLVFLSVLSA